MTDKWPEEEGFISEGEIVSLFKATAAISKGTLVQLTGDLEVQPAVADSDPIGVSLKDVESGESVPVCIHGVCKVKAGGAITRGKAVKSDASARAIELSDQAVDEGGTALAVDSKHAGVLFIRRDITAEDYEDPVKDLAGVSVTARWAYATLRADAIGKVTGC